MTWIETTKGTKETKKTTNIENIEIIHLLAKNNNWVNEKLRFNWKSLRVGGKTILVC